MAARERAAGIARLRSQSLRDDPTTRSASHVVGRSVGARASGVEARPEGAPSVPRPSSPSSDALWRCVIVLTSRGLARGTCLFFRSLGMIDCFGKKGSVAHHSPPHTLGPIAMIGMRGVRTPRPLRAHRRTVARTDTKLRPATNKQQRQRVWARQLAQIRPTPFFLHDDQENYEPRRSAQGPPRAA